MPTHLKKYKDLEKAKATRKRQKNRNYNKNDFSTHAKRKWEEWEEEYILNNTGDVEIAKKLNRSLRAIHVKRSKLKAEQDKPTDGICVACGVGEV